MRKCLLLAVVCVLTCGCGGGASDQVEVFETSGTITYEGGIPVVGASVSFAPLDGQPVAIGKTDDDGVYKLRTYAWEDGAAAGKFEVLLQKSIIKPTSSAPEGGHDSNTSGNGAPAHDARRSKQEESIDEINTKYASRGSGLEAEVTASGPNVFDFEISR